MTGQDVTRGSGLRVLQEYGELDGATGSVKEPRMPGGPWEWMDVRFLSKRVEGSVLWEWLLGHNGVMITGPQGVRTCDLSRVATLVWDNKAQGQGSGYPDKKMQYCQVMGKLLSHPDLTNIILAFTADFPFSDKGFPGSFPGSSISVHFISL